MPGIGLFCHKNIDNISTIIHHNNMGFYFIVKWFHKGSYLKYYGYIKLMTVHKSGCQILIVLRVDFKKKVFSTFDL